MRKKILLVGVPVNIHNIVDELAEKLKTNEIEIESLRIKNITLELDKYIKIYFGNLDINKFDYIWLSSSWKNTDICYILDSYLKSKKVRSSPVGTSYSKITDLYHLQENNVLIPHTFCIHRKSLSTNYDNLATKLGTPFILKPPDGCKGNSIYLIHSLNELESAVVKEDKIRYWTCQKFIPNSFDYRVLVSYGSVLSVEKRIRQKNEFRNNAALGAEEIFLEFEEVDIELQRLAIEATEVLGLNWAGVDIVQSDEDRNYYILEVNRSPGFEPNTSETEAAYRHILSLMKKNTDF